MITKLYYDYPQHYSRLRAKWDPTGEYHRRFEEYLRGLQFNVISNDNGNVFNQIYFLARILPVFSSNVAPSNGNVPQASGSAPSQVVPTSTTPTTRQVCRVCDYLSLTPDAHFPNYHCTSIIRHISSFRLYPHKMHNFNHSHTHNLYTFFPLHIT